MEGFGERFPKEKTSELSLRCREVEEATSDKRRKDGKMEGWKGREVFFFFFVFNSKCFICANFIPKNSGSMRIDKGHGGGGVHT